MKNFYILLDKYNIIRDIIEYPQDGYIEVQLQTPLPVGINGGWYKFENGSCIEIPELKPVNGIEQRIIDIESAITAILGGATQ